VALLDDELGGRMQARRGELMDALGGGGLVAAAGAQRVGLLCWRLGPESSAEITALAVDRESRRRGVGRALLDAAAAALRELGVDRVWLVTTNENLEALALYQKAGYRLTALHAGAIDDLRRRLKPSIPEVASNGIPIHDELELGRDL
jgi:ribosomal protein S18 acetylase RimI-like enzyme